MTPKTKKIFIASLILAGATIGALIMAWYMILGQRDQLQKQVSILTENSAKQDSYSRIRKQLTETEEERASLAAAFFAAEGDSIAFLNEIESLAAMSNLKLETKALDKITEKETNETFIQMRFSYEGNKESVLTFSTLMETIPYYSRVTALSIEKMSDNNWSGEITIQISIATL